MESLCMVRLGHFVRSDIPCLVLGLMQFSLSILNAGSFICLLSSDLELAVPIVENIVKTVCGT